MKQIIKWGMLLVGVVFFFAACDKVADLPMYSNGNAPVLSVSATTLAPAPADSNNTILTITWTDPKHATDTSNYKFVVEMDSTGKNFTRINSKTVLGKRSMTFTAKEINTFLLARGYAFNIPVDLDVRGFSSYGNNNERLMTNTVKIKYTPYKIPPKVALPASGKLFIVGSATQGDWGNPVPVPTQELSRIDETTFGGIFQLKATAEYLILPVNGDWTNKFSVANKSLAGLNLGGDFGYNSPDNFPGPTAAGWYTIIMDFQAGKFTVTPYTGTLPTNLFMVGDATAGGWNNPVPVPAQQLTRLNSVEWEKTLPLIGGKEFLLLPVNGDWANKYSVANKSLLNLWMGGDFGYNRPDNFPGPTNSGTYKVSVNFATGKFKVN